MVDESDRLPKTEEDQAHLYIVKMFKIIERQAELRSKPADTFRKIEVMINDIMPIIYHRTRSNTSSRFRRKISNLCKAESIPPIKDSVSKD